MKRNKRKGIDLDNTMLLWPKNTKKTIKKLEEPFLYQQERTVIKTDLQYIQSIKTDRVANYTSLDIANISRIEKRNLKERKKSQNHLAHQ